jgi:NAD(P)-dependent dehydrogenase (short-subunit alcohol dehydrogenase family)
MEENIQGKVVVITGASSGLGEATARRLSAEGATVVLGARRSDRLQSLTQEFDAKGAKSLAVTSGLGWVQGEGGPVQEIRPGDVVWFPAGLRHWHGASPTTAMSHIAIQEQRDGKVVDWMEKVADEQYRR